MGSLLSPSQEYHPSTPSSLAYDLVVSASKKIYFPHLKIGGKMKLSLLYDFQ